jgi:glycosyltransferase involved in cell wall biosynthesis
VPLRVAFDYRPALLGHAGISRAARELARALAPLPELELHLFGHCFARARLAPTVSAHLHRLPIPGRLQPLLARVGLDAGRLSGRPAVFHWTDTIHPPVRRARRVLTLHDAAFAEDPSWHGPAAEGLLQRARAAAAAADVVVTSSQASLESIVRHLGVARAKLRHIPLGADHVRPGHTTHPLQGEPYLLSLGTIEPRKNHARLLAAWRAMAPRPRLVVVGRAGWQCESVGVELEAAQRRGELLWRTQADDAEAFRWLQHCRLLAYPSLLEGFGLPPLEAIALGVPVVAGDTPALREVLGDAAEYCAPLEVESIRAAMQRAWSEEGLRARIVQRGRARAAEFRWDECARRHAALYAALADA